MLLTSEYKFKHNTKITQYAINRSLQHYAIDRYKKMKEVNNIVDVII